MHKVNRKNLIRFVDIGKEAEKNNSEKPSFLELLNLIDFRDDLRYK